MVGTHTKDFAYLCPLARGLAAVGVSASTFQFCKATLRILFAANGKAVCVVAACLRVAFFYCFRRKTL